MKNNTTVVLVVDFANRNLLAREELSGSNSKKEKEKLERIQNVVSKLTLGEAVLPIATYQKVKEEKKAS